MRAARNPAQAVGGVLAGRVYPCWQSYPYQWHLDDPGWDQSVPTCNRTAKTDDQSALIAKLPRLALFEISELLSVSVRTNKTHPGPEQHSANRGGDNIRKKDNADNFQEYEGGNFVGVNVVCSSKYSHRHE
jgi:hypothetical protein